nr:carboxypeptidase regulatory-like domain-containing protein [Vicinamibacteria bacterium]
MKRFQIALTCLLVLAFGFVATAQEQGGSIQGVVKDASGSVIPGATVEAKAAAGSTFSTTSGSDGAFRFPSLPAGKYTVTASLAGFTTARFESVTLSLGQNLRTDFNLKVGGQTEQVEVTAEAPIVDMKQTARINSFRDEAITKMPKGRDFTSLVTQSPGANSESKLGGISIDGASGAENRYIIDGAETTNIQNGTSGKALITDFVDEVEVKSSGYTAEYGGATGGIINAVTKSGTNAW